MKLGFIGTGNITVAVVNGICNSKISYSQIIVSSRNKKKALNLKKNFRKIVVARTNQEIDTRHTEFSVNSATPFKRDDFIQIDGEVMRITKITGDRLHVLRGQFSTMVENHDLNVRISASSD